MCFSSPKAPSPIPPAPPQAPILAPKLETDSTMNQFSQINRNRLGKKALQIPLTGVTQSGLGIPTNNK
jgi:hypothetical protein